MLPDFMDRAGGFIKKLEIKSKLGNIEVEYDENKKVVKTITRDQKFLRYNTYTRQLDFKLDEGERRMLQASKNKLIKNVTYGIDLILTDSFDKTNKYQF